MLVEPQISSGFWCQPEAPQGPVAVPPDSGECVEALELIKALPLDGALVTGDAAFATFFSSSGVHPQDMGLRR